MDEYHCLEAARSVFFRGTTATPPGTLLIMERLKNPNDHWSMDLAQSVMPHEGFFVAKTQEILRHYIHDDSQMPRVVGPQ